MRLTNKAAKTNASGCFGTNRSNRRQLAAFTLTEVLVAVLIFAFVVTSGYLGLVQGYNIIDTSRDDLRATQILEDKAEIVRLYTWTQITNSSFTPSTFTDYFNPTTATNVSQGVTYYGTVAVGNPPFSGPSYLSDIVMVTFQLNWTNNKVAHQRSINTLVSRYGVHNYTYGP